MTGDAVPRIETRTGRPWLRRSWWPALRIVLLVAWLAWAVAAWWAAPRPAGTAQAAADLSAGRIVSYQWAAGWESNAGWGWSAEATPRTSGVTGPLFVWRTGDWRVHYTEFDRDPTYRVTPDPSWSAPDLGDGTSDAGDDSPDGRYSGPQAAAFDARLLAAAPDGRWQGPQAPTPVRVLPMLLLLAVLGTLVLGPAPARGTRWCWFWALTGMPFGLGVLWWLARERPWSSAEPPPTTPTGRDPRNRWYVGLLTAIATSIVASLLLYGLGRLLGDRLVPPGAGAW